MSVRLWLWHFVTRCNREKVTVGVLDEVSKKRKQMPKWLDGSGDFRDEIRGSEYKWG